MATAIEQKQIRLDQLRAKLVKLEDNMVSGILEIEDEGKRLRNVSFADMQRAEAKLKSLIAALEAELGTTSTRRTNVGLVSPAPAV